MLNELKYIITSNDEIIIFDARISHKDFKFLNPKSAGFISFGINLDTNKPYVSCYGDSFTLKLSSHPEDEKLIMRRLFNTYI